MIGVAENLTTQTTLDNGLAVTIETGWSSPHAAVAWHFPVGMVDDPPNAPGLAHLLEHLLFQNVVQGTGATAVERHHAEGGGFSDGTTHFEYTDFYRRLTADRIIDAIDFDVRRFSSPQFTDDDIVGQREAIGQEARSRLSSSLPNFPWPLLHWNLERDLASGHDGVGSEATLRGVSLADCTDFFAAHYVPDGASVTIIANDMTSSDRQHILERLATVPSRPRTARPVPAHIPSPQRLMTIHEESIDTERAFVVHCLPPLTSASLTTHLASLVGLDATALSSKHTPASRGTFGLLDTCRQDYAIKSAPLGVNPESLLALVDKKWESIQAGGTREWKAAVGRLLTDVYSLMSDVSTRARFRGKLSCLWGDLTPEDVLLRIGEMGESDLPATRPIVVTIAPDGEYDSSLGKEFK